ncbi:hypothetical protein ACP26F_15755 [Franconibacter pulveris 1160]|uniref:hypothetical protein n=1 Tax=Franconibacter TaxID=1649295 RepID=UPI000467D922|nr:MULTISPECIES: hypothetical protein [Franconibacter]MCK1970391.1 hypothetical protein [Franconibacter sp. IITDAS19]
MNKQLLLLILVICPSVVWGEITPEVNMPDNISETQPVMNRLEEQYSDYNAITNSGCGDVTFKDFTPEPYRSQKDKKNNPVYKGITFWVCDFENTVKEDGFGPGRLLPEKVYFDKKSGTWKKKKYHLSKDETKESLRRYGISNISDLQPVALYNIESVNAKGYAVINSNIPKEDRDHGVKGKTISFCLMHDGDALCGSGPMVYTFDGKDVDFSPYVLKSLETIEMGLPSNL